MSPRGSCASAKCGNNSNAVPKRSSSHHQNSSRTSIKQCTMLRSLMGNPSSRILAKSHTAISTLPLCRRQIYNSSPAFRRLHYVTRGHSLLQLEPRRKIPGTPLMLGVSSFHSTPRRQGAPIIPFLLGALKVSSFL